MKTVMVGYNDSDEARDALALGKVLSEATGATLVLAGVVEADFPYGPGADDFRVRQEQRLREELAEAAVGIGVESHLRVIAARSPAHGLHALAEREATDVLVLGSSHRSGLGRVLAGSVTERVLQAAPCAVAIASRGFRNQARLVPRVIAVGFDGFPESRRALAFSRDLAEACGAELRVIAVQEADVIFGGDRGTVVRSERERLEGALNEAVDRLPASVRPQGSLLPGSATEVLAHAAQGVDLLVVGSRGYGPVRRVLLGGVSSALVRSAPCPILVVPRGEAVQAEDVAAVETSALHA